MLPDLCMPLCSIAQALQFFIILRHQPFISSFTLIWTTTLLSCRRSKVLSTTSLVVWKFKTKNPYQKELASFIFHIASYSYLLLSILQTFFNVVAPSAIHCLTQLLSSITHEQTRSPTHAFLATEIEWVFGISAQKLMAIDNNQTKRQNPKTCCVHTN